jgi:hypothetical protein
MRPELLAALAASGGSRAGWSPRALRELGLAPDISHHAHDG